MEVEQALKSRAVAMLMHMDRGPAVWKHTGHKHHITTYSSPDPLEASSVPLNMGECVMPGVTPADVLNLWSSDDVSVRRQWNEHINKSEVLEKLNDHCKIVYYYAPPKKGGIIAARDFVVGIQSGEQSFSLNPDEQPHAVQYSYSSSIPTLDVLRAPPKGAVRGHLHHAMVSAMPNPESSDAECIVRYCMRSDPGGKIPHAFLGSALHDEVVHTLNTLRAILTKK